MRVRPDTWDSKIAEAVICNNEYQLPASMKGWTVVDIGAHIGAFAMACQSRKAANVYCYEADTENFQILFANTDDKDSSTHIYLANVAVVGRTSAAVGIRRLRNHDFDNGRNTGHVDVFGAPDGTDVIEIASVLANCDKQVIDLVKIDCEGTEWDILDKIDLSRVQRLVGELHDITGITHPLVERFNKIPFDTLCSNLAGVLTDAGFNVIITPTAAGMAKLSAQRNAVVAETTVRTNSIPRVLWVGDCVMQTGNARVTENICRGLVQKGWDVRVLGSGYNGDPHSLPFRVYPAIDGPGAIEDRSKGNPYGTGRLAELYNKLKPDVIVIQNDTWNVATMTDTMAALNIWSPVVGYIAVDSENVRQDLATQLSGLRHAVCHTQFGVDQLLAAQYTGKYSIAGHGVDTNIYFPCDKKAAREGFKVKDRDLTDAFIWGCVNVNQPRKRLDLVVAYFAAWWKRAGRPDDAYLYVHTNLRGSWDLRQLGDYFGIRNRMISTEGGKLPEAYMANLYSSIDVMLSCAEGESWSLCSHESMACGVANIAVRCGGLPSWAGDAILWVEPSVYTFTDGGINTKRWIATEEDYVEAMHRIYSNRDVLDMYSQRSLEVARKYQWQDTIEHFHDILTKTVKKARIATTQKGLEEFFA